MLKDTRLYQLVEPITKALEDNRQADIRPFLDGLSSAEIARLIDAMPKETRQLVWPYVSTEQVGEVLLSTHKKLRLPVYYHR